MHLGIFAMGAASGLDLRAVTRAVLPYFPVAFAILLLITFVPWLSVGVWR